MAKITRYSGDLKPFASNSTGLKRTVFGDTTQADDIDSNITPDFLLGWESIGDETNNFPTIQDFNAMGYTHGQLLAYLHQMGLPEWGGVQEYHSGSVVNLGGVLYVCQTDSHVSATPPNLDATNWKAVAQANVDSIAALRLTTPGTTPVQPLGYYTTGDGGGGPLRVWKTGAIGTYVDNGGSIIVPTGGDGSGAWVWEYSGDIYPEWFGADGTRNGDSLAIRAAISTQSAIRLSAKRYYYDGVVITNPVIRIYGSALPTVNSGKTALENGSIIDGTFGFTSPDADLRNFGVDVGSASSAAEGDAIRGTAPLNDGGHLHTENIIGLCKSPSSAHHALLFQSYQKHTGGNLLGVYGLFGFVSKCQNVALSLIHSIENNESGVLLKSDTGFGRCRNVSIQRVKCEGGVLQKRGFHIQSSDDGVRDVQIGMIETDGCNENVLLQVGSGGIELRNIDIASIRSKNARDDDFNIDNLNVGAYIFNVNVGVLITENTLSRGLKVQGVGNTENFNIESAFISYEAAAVQATMDGAAFIGANCTRSRIGDLVIIRNFNLGGLVGGITYNANKENHILGSHVATVYGTERPRPGFSSQVISGTGNSLILPVNKAGDAYGLSNIAAITAGTNINSFAPPVSGAEDFAHGHSHALYNSSAQSITIVHNPAGGIYNKGSINRIILPGEVVVWVHTGLGLWREV